MVDMVVGTVMFDVVVLIRAELVNVLRGSSSCVLARDSIINSIV